MPLSTLDPKVALVVIDLQKGIVGYNLAHPAAGVVKNSADLARAFRERGLPVVLVNVAGRAPGRTDAAKNAPATAAPAADWAELVPELDVQPTDILVTKHRIGAFSVPALQESLAERGVTQLVFTGISTTSGVEATARAAYDLGYHVVLVADAVTDLDATNHDHAMAAVFPRIGEVTTTAEVLATLENN
jgi:nicotinamidase-related amidase